MKESSKPAQGPLDGLFLHKVTREQLDALQESLAAHVEDYFGRYHDYRVFRREITGGQVKPRMNDLVLTELKPDGVHYHFGIIHLRIAFGVLWIDGIHLHCFYPEREARILQALVLEIHHAAFNKPDRMHLPDTIQSVKISGEWANAPLIDAAATSFGHDIFVPIETGNQGEPHVDYELNIVSKRH